MTTRVKKVKTVALFTGYVETLSMGCVLLVHHKGFNSLQEALMDLRERFEQAYREWLDRNRDTNEFRKSEIKRFNANYNMLEEDYSETGLLTPIHTFWTFPTESKS